MAATVEEMKAFTGSAAGALSRDWVALYEECARAESLAWTGVGFFDWASGLDVDAVRNSLAAIRERVTRLSAVGDLGRAADTEAGYRTWVSVANAQRDGIVAQVQLLGSASTLARFVDEVVFATAVDVGQGAKAVATTAAAVTSAAVPWLVVGLVALVAFRGLGLVRGR